MVGSPSLCRSIPEGFESVSEGKATVLSQGNSVFYNRAQVVNRDISIAVLRWFIEEGFEKEKKKRSQRTGPKPQVPSEDRIQVSATTLTRPCTYVS